MTAKELRALLKAEHLCREDLALFLGVDPKKPAAWERGEQPITSENAQQIQKALAEFREARASLQACGLWVPIEKRAEDADYTGVSSGAAEAQPVAEPRALASGQYRSLTVAARTELDTAAARTELGTGVRAAGATSRKRRASKSRLFALWGALRSSFL